MNSAYIVDGVRTPIGNFGGSLSGVRSDDLGAFVLKSLMKKHPNLDYSQIGDVILGCANQAGEDNRNVARMALLLAGMPVTVPGETVNRLCASGLSAVIAGARAIQVGEGDLMVAGGVENMTRGPWILSKTSTPFGREMQLFDSSFGWRFIHPKMQEIYGTEAMGETAENLAERDGISREDQDLFAFNSQQKAKKAQDSGRFALEIEPIELPAAKGDKSGEPRFLKQDEFMKPTTTLDTLAKLKAAFRKGGSVTAGNASGLNDGAAAVLLASEIGLKKNGLKPLARIVSSAVTGVEPKYMGYGPVSASLLALKRAGLTLKDIDLIELNEAFAAQSLSCIRGLGLTDNDPRINPNGGAIALGHPLGMSGARLAYSAALELHQPYSVGKKYALITLCIGVGQGYAAIIEKV